MKNCSLGWGTLNFISGQNIRHTSLKKNTVFPTYAIKFCVLVVVLWERNGYISMMNPLWKHYSIFY